MSRSPILQPGQAYTFIKYFELPFDTEDILAEFGCTYERLNIDFPKYQGELDLQNLERQLEKGIRLVDSTSEAARRETLVAPVLLELCELTHTKLKIEYAVLVNEQLKGSLDYYIQSTNSLLVVEAKQADLTRGFTQLAVELIALDQWVRLESAVLYGAVTTGDIWKFGLFHRREKRIVQDLNLFRVPADLEELMRIAIALLTHPPNINTVN